MTNAFINVVWTVPSDTRLKEIKGPVPLGLEFVEKLSTIEYKRKDPVTGEVNNEEVRYGFKAQEVQSLEVNPEEPVIVNTSSEYLGLKHEYLLPVLVNAIKELSEKVKTLEGKNK